MDTITKLFGDYQTLPRLPLGPPPFGNNGYINWIQPESMSSSVMWGLDTYLRPFIALKVRDRHNNQVSVWCLFQMIASYSTGPWAIGSSTNDRHVYEPTLNQPFKDDTAEMLQLLIRDAHLHYKLS